MGAESVSPFRNPWGVLRVKQSTCWDMTSHSCIFVYVNMNTIHIYIYTRVYNYMHYDYTCVYSIYTSVYLQCIYIYISCQIIASIIHMI